MLGVPVLALALVLMKVPFRVPRRYWPELLWLTRDQHADLARLHHPGRAEPVQRARRDPGLHHADLLGGASAHCCSRAALSRRAWLGVGAAALGVGLLLWHEFTGLAGRPAGVALALFAAATWALGTQLLRRTRIELPTLTLSFWMTAITGIVITVLAVVFDRSAVADAERAP